MNEQPLPPHDPPPPERWLSWLDPACAALQRLDKEFRTQRNRGHASESEVAAIKAALSAIRQLYYSRRLSPPDLDSRGARRKPKGA